MDFDLKIDYDGNLVLGPDGSYEIVTGDELLLQRVMFRLRTTLGDYLVNSLVGTNLEDIIGTPNSPETHLEIKRQVSISLDQVPDMRPFNVYVAATQAKEVLVAIEISPKKGQNQQIQKVFILDTARQVVRLRE